MNSGPENDDGVIEGTEDGAEAEVDPESIGPHGTEYDDDATEEAKRKMTGG